MKRFFNVGKTDRILRAAVGLVLGGLYLGGLVTGTLGTITLVASLALLATATIGFCGAYTLLGINTCPIKK